MNRDYIYHSYTRTLCNVCKKPIDGKIVYNKDGVFILKSCPEHGESMVLLEEDYEYHLSKQRYDKPGTKSTTQTLSNKGCPFDCGLCPSHDQHSCIGLIEVTTRCNLGCPTCYARAGRGEDLDMETIAKMMDFFIESENGRAEILQISGGEPSIHPQILDIIQMAKDKGIHYVMLNTNGLRIAEDRDFAQALGKFRGGFEVYLQFDGLDDSIYQKLRGRNLVKIKQQAIANLMAFSVPVTLVCTVDKGVNDESLAEVLAYGMDNKSIRGVNFQPVRFFGRIDENRWNDRITLSGIINRIEKQTKGMIGKNAFIPLPCDVERVAISYLFKSKNGFSPIFSDRDVSIFKDYIRNTFMFNMEDTMKDLEEAGVSFARLGCCDIIGDIKKFLQPAMLLKSKEQRMEFIDKNVFRISVSAFVDIYDFDMKAVQKECVHVITPDLKRIPFSAFNMIHRDKYNKFYE